MKRRRVVTCVLAAASIAMLADVTAAAAQDAGGSTSGTPPATPPAPTPPPATTPPAAQTAPSGSPETKLPDVDVIQQQPKPTPTPVKQAVKPKPKPAVVQAPPPPATPPEEVAAEPTGIKMSPVAGSEIPIEKVPGGVSTVSAREIASSGSVVPQDYLAQHVPGITVSDIQGNGFQTDIQYRGFEASPVNGVAQGIAVYQNGVRINEAFGDVVNLDFLPELAIESVTVLSGNPIFGLNALGGSINFTMKDGFNYQGAEVDVRGGSFGRIQESAQFGMRSGNVAAYMALDNIHDDGWREFSPTDIRRVYADLGFKGDGSELHFNFTGADNNYGVTAAAPEELLAAGYNRAFTSPQTTENELAMVSVNGSVKATDKITLSGVAYYRHFEQYHVDGNLSDIADCDGTTAPSGTLCGDDGSGDQITSNSSNPFVDQVTGHIDSTILAVPPGAFGSIDRTSQIANSEGFTLQATNKEKVFGLNNQFIAGTSYDHADVGYKASSELGFFGPHFVVNSFDPAVPLTGEDDDFKPRNLAITNDYVGVYALDSIDLTSRLTFTAGGRFNYARIQLQNLNDPNDTNLNTTNTFTRFNPTAGATYKLLPGMTLYGGYSEANRAPTPAELACANPAAPCLIESFLTSDPPLKQVVSHTWELGVRGDYGTRANHFEWSAGLFRALNTDDIVTQLAPNAARGYFVNATDTLRQGLEASAMYTTDRYRVYASYNYTDATFEKGYEQFTPNNPQAGPCSDGSGNQCVDVVPGDHIPGVPAHKFKAGFDYWLTHKWKFGADVIATSGQYFYGDESNLNAKLGGYAKVNLHTSYDVTDKIQVYGLVDNLFDKHFGTYGTFFDTAGASDASLGEFTFTNPRTISPSQPFAAYGGVKVKY